MEKTWLRSVAAAPARACSAHAPVDEIIVAWQQLADQLCPLIGQAGFCALYARAQRLALAPEQRLALDRESDLRSASIVLELLRSKLLSQQPDAAIEANAALAATFNELLAGLIGQGLTARLQNKAWANLPKGIS